MLSAYLFIFNNYREDYTADDFYREYYTSFAVVISILVLFFLYWKYWNDAVDMWRRMRGKNVPLPKKDIAQGTVWCVKCNAYSVYEPLREEEKMGMLFVTSKCRTCGTEAIKRIE